MFRHSDQPSAAIGSPILRTRRCLCTNVRRWDLTVPPTSEAIVAAAVEQPVLATSCSGLGVIGVPATVRWVGVCVGSIHRLWARRALVSWG